MINLQFFCLGREAAGGGASSIILGREVLWSSGVFVRRFVESVGVADLVDKNLNENLHWIFSSSFKNCFDSQYWKLVINFLFSGAHNWRNCAVSYQCASENFLRERSYSQSSKQNKRRGRTLGRRKRPLSGPSPRRIIITRRETGVLTN